MRVLICNSCGAIKQFVKDAMKTHCFCGRQPDDKPWVIWAVDYILTLGELENLMSHSDTAMKGIMHRMRTED